MKNIKPANIIEVLQSALARFSRYKVLIFALMVIGVYGYVILTISMLSSAQPTEDQINELSSPIKSAKIDEKVVRQLQQLQDNSVSVKALFDKARDNPFQEN